MTITERLYRLAAVAFPAECRAANGDEMVESALEFSNGFSAREALALVTGGLRTRARHGLRGSSESLTVAAIRLGIFLYMLAAAVMVTTEWILGSPTTGVPLWFEVLVVVVPGLMLWSTGRLTASLHTAAAAFSWTMILLDSEPHPAPLRFLALTLLFHAALWWLAMRSDGRRVMRPTRGFALFAGLVGLTVLTAHSGIAETWQGYDATPLAFLLAFFVLALVAAPFDPRLAFGMVAYTIYHGAGIVMSWTLNRDVLPDDFVVVPLIVAIATTAVLASTGTLGARRLHSS